MERTILITGGTGGLGTNVVQRLAKTYPCVVFYRREEEWEQLRQTIEAAESLRGIRADLTSEAAVNQAVEQARSDSVFALVHLVGGFEMGTIEQTSLESWDRMLEVNLTSAFLIMRAVIPRLQTGGRIVAISSAAAVQPGAGMGAYTVSKSALNTLVEVLAVELKDRSITVNAILPNALDTPLMRQQMDRSRLIPLDRVADTILFLLSNSAANLTGSKLVLRA